jgi:hypothetical protein
MRRTCWPPPIATRIRNSPPSPFATGHRRGPLAPPNPVNGHPPHLGLGRRVILPVTAEENRLANRTPQLPHRAVLRRFHAALCTHTVCMDERMQEDVGMREQEHEHPLTIGQSTSGSWLLPRPSIHSISHHSGFVTLHMQRALTWSIPLTTGGTLPRTSASRRWSRTLKETWFYRKGHDANRDASP